MENLLALLLRKKILCCEICHEQMDTVPVIRMPKCLDCSHTFCASCLESRSFGSDIFSSVICPTCNEETTVGIDGIDGLNNNLTIIRVLDVLKELESLQTNFDEKQSYNDCNIINPVSQSDSNSTQNSITDTSSDTIRKRSKSLPLDTRITAKTRASVVAILEIPTVKLGKLLGVRGINIKNIRSRCRCSIEIKKGENNISEIIFRGAENFVTDAYYMVSSIVTPKHNSNSAGKNHELLYCKSEEEHFDSSLSENANHILNESETSHSISSFPPWLISQSKSVTSTTDSLLSIKDHAGNGKLNKIASGDSTDIASINHIQHLDTFIPSGSSSNENDPDLVSLKSVSSDLPADDSFSTSEQLETLLGTSRPPAIQLATSATFVGATGEQKWRMLNSADHLPKKTAVTNTSTTTAIRVMLECRPDQIGKLIGLKGCRIKDMRNRSGARIEVIKGCPLCRIEISGAADQVALGHSMINSILDKDKEKDNISNPSPHTAPLIRLHSSESDPGTPRNMISKVFVNGHKSSSAPSSRQNSNKLLDDEDDNGDVDDAFEDDIDLILHDDGDEVTKLRLSGSSALSSSENSAGFCIASFLAEKAKQKDTRLLEELASNSSFSGPMNTVTVQCPLHMVPILIGKKGVTIKDITSQTGSQISVDHTVSESVGGSSFSAIRIRGYPYQIAYAQELIECIIAGVTLNNSTQRATGLTPTTVSSSSQHSSSEDQFVDGKQLSSSESTSFSEWSTDSFACAMNGGTNGISAIELHVSTDVCTAILSPSNKNLFKDIRQLSGANLLFDKGQDAPDSSTSTAPATSTAARVIHIWGSSVSVICARDLLAHRLSLSDVRALTRPYTGQIADLDLKFRRTQILKFDITRQPSLPSSPSKQGSADDAVTGASSVKIDSSPARAVTACSGPDDPDGSSNAVCVTDTADVVVEEEWECPHDKVSIAIGRRGTVIREIKRRTSCGINIQNSVTKSKTHVDMDVQIFTFVGSKSRVSAAMRLVKSVLEIGPIEALQMTADCLECPHDKVAVVIGANGVTVKEIMRRSGCRITVNELHDERPVHIVDLIGTTQQIESAKEIILSIIHQGVKIFSRKM